MNDRTLLLYGIPRRYLKADLEEALKRVSDRRPVDEFIAGERQGLFLPGMNGCGKTYLSCAIMIEMMKRRVHSYRSDAVQLVRQYTDGSNWEIPAKFLQPKLLVLDEVAKELDSKVSLVAIETLVTWRGENDKQTIIVSNFGLTQIAERYGPTLPSKMREFYTPVRLPDEDLRKIGPPK